MIAGYPLSELAYLAAALAFAGAATGILAGVFGVGGGAVIVPVLYELFRLIGVPEETRMPLCVGTSLAIIIPTSIRSFRSHQARGAVDMNLLRAWAVPTLFGVLIGSGLARFAPPSVFKIVFVLVAGMSAARLLLNLRWNLGPDVPKGPALRVFGFVNGVLSALMGIGGGQIATMYMTFYGRTIHQAVATSSGVGVLISIPGAIGYVLAGWGKPDLPPLSLGFVSLLGIAAFAPVAVLTAPLGVRLAHALSKRKLETAFGVFLLLVSLRFLASILGY
ncbi:MAG: hypothetical protein JWM36_1832 [Hyphomicrobiales bacterium]|nr:hypothetical protein [Hyphomicrobiales bacterium]